jgi:hypothetical protein
MLLPFTIGAALIVMTVLIHGFGTTWMLRVLLKHHIAPDGSLLPNRAQSAIILTAIGLLLMHWVQIMLWAGAYQLLIPVAPIGTFEEALYFSVVTFTTVGYGDITLGAEDWRLLSGIEALNGVLLLGWSTAVLYAVVHRSWNTYL